MKKFFANNWKKILFIIGTILIILNIGTKVIQEPEVVTGYIENGPVIEKDIFDKVEDTAIGATTKIEDNAADIKDGYGEQTGIDAKLYRILIIAGAIVLGILILSSLVEGDSKKAEKKK